MPSFDILGSNPYGAAGPASSSGQTPNGRTFNSVPLVGQQQGASGSGAVVAQPSGLLAGILGLPSYGGPTAQGQAQPGTGQAQPNIGTAASAGLRSLFDGITGAGR